MNEFTEIEQFDTSVLEEEPIFGEDNEIIGYFGEEDYYAFEDGWVDMAEREF
jgi:hypothetical protein